MNKLCNICGKEINGFIITTLNHQFGYGTSLDGDTLDLNMCECCTENFIKNLVATCKINPIQEKEAEEYGFGLLFINNEIILLY